MKWFKEVFLKSFDTCEYRKITEKQADIFKKYLDREGELYNAEYYYSIIDNKSVKLQCSSSYNGSRRNSKGVLRPLYKMEYYITIKQI